LRGHAGLEQGEGEFAGGGGRGVLEFHADLGDL
jgi:hypothetical protein